MKTWIFYQSSLTLPMHWFFYINADRVSSRKFPTDGTKSPQPSLTADYVILAAVYSCLSNKFAVPGFAVTIFPKHKRNVTWQIEQLSTKNCEAYDVWLRWSIHNRKSHVPITLAKPSQGSARPSRLSFLSVEGLHVLVLSWRIKLISITCHPREDISSKCVWVAVEWCNWMLLAADIAQVLLQMRLVWHSQQSIPRCNDNIIKSVLIEWPKGLERPLKILPPITPSTATCQALDEITTPWSFFCVIRYSWPEAQTCAFETKSSLTACLHGRERAAPRQVKKLGKCLMTQWESLNSAAPQCTSVGLETKQ